MVILSQQRSPRSYPALWVCRGAHTVSPTDHITNSTQAGSPRHSGSSTWPAAAAVRHTYKKISLSSLPKRWLGVILSHLEGCNIHNFNWIKASEGPRLKAETEVIETEIRLCTFKHEDHRKKKKILKDGVTESLLPDICKSRLEVFLGDTL